MGSAAQRCNRSWHCWLAGTCTKVVFFMFQALGFPWLVPSGNRATSSNDLQKVQSLLGLGTSHSPISRTHSGSGSRRGLETLSLFSWIWAEHQVHQGARKHLVLMSLNHLADIVHSPAVDAEGPCIMSQQRASSGMLLAVFFNQSLLSGMGRLLPALVQLCRGSCLGSPQGWCHRRAG